MTLSPTQIPPYVSHRTFTTFLESLKSGIPDRIDGSVFDASFSGTSRKQVTSALKSLSLVDDDLRPTATLESLVMATGDKRKSVWRELLKETYEPVFILDLQTATPFQLREELRKIVRTDSMLIKCESFFKHAAVDAGIRLSPHIMRRKLVRRRKKAEPRAPKPEVKNAPDLAVDTPPATQPAAAAAVSAVPPGPSADGVWQLFPKFDPNWSDEARENWLAGIERITFALTNKVGNTISDETHPHGAAR